MRRPLVMGFLFLIAALTVSTLAAPFTPNVAAQEDAATPAASSGDDVSGGPVSFVEESGSEIATLNVVRLVRPWTEFDEYYEPETGTEYVAVEIEVEHAGRRGDLVLRAFDFRVQDVDGFLISQAFTRAAEDAELAPMEDEIAVPPGETVSIVVVFQVIEGIELSHLYWMPDYDRLITLADLSES